MDPDRAAWELYNVDSDFSQANDLAAANPEKRRELQDLWWVEAAKYKGGLIVEGEVTFDACQPRRPTTTSAGSSRSDPRTSSGNGTRRSRS